MNSKRVLFDINNGNILWVKSDSEWDYYVYPRREEQLIRVHKSDKRVQFQKT